MLDQSVMAIGISHYGHIPSEVTCYMVYKRVWDILWEPVDS